MRHTRGGGGGGGAITPPATPTPPPPRPARYAHVQLHPPPPNPTTPSSQIFCHCKADDAAANGLYRTTQFTLLGRIPKHYAIDGAKHDAHVWVMALQGSHVIRYRPPEHGKPVNLARADALVPVRVWRMAPWVRVLCLQFGLPIGLVVAMFLVSYALVVAGPLKGISGAVTPAGGVDPHANVLDEGEYDEL